MGGELTEGVGEQKPTLHDQNTTSNPALKTTSTQAFQEISSPFSVRRSQDKVPMHKIKIVEKVHITYVRQNFRLIG